MKQFMLFAGCNYYATGGMSDFVFSSDTLDECLDYLTGNYDNYYGWFHVYNSETGSVVEASEYGAHGTNYKEGKHAEQINKLIEQSNTIKTKTPSNEELKKLASKFPPPDEYFSGYEPNPFEDIRSKKAPTTKPPSQRN